MIAGASRGIRLPESAGIPVIGRVAAGNPIKELVTFKNVTKPWLAREGLDEKIVSALHDALLSVKDAKALEALAADGFTDGTDDDYASTREAVRINGEFTS